MRTLMIDLLTIDLDTCDRCLGADAAIAAALEQCAADLASLGATAVLRKRVVRTANEARALRMVTSPTIQIDGIDIQPEAPESQCGACSTLPGQDSVDCRVWHHAGRFYDSPPPALIAEALLAAARTKPAPVPAGSYELPANLEAFFSNKKGCGCGC